MTQLHKRYLLSDEFLPHKLSGLKHVGDVVEWADPTLGGGRVFIPLLSVRIKYDIYYKKCCVAVSQQANIRKYRFRDFRGPYAIFMSFAICILATKQG